MNRTGITDESKFTNVLSQKAQKDFGKKNIGEFENNKRQDNKGFKDKLKKRLDDAKRIDEDPSAFTEPDDKEGEHLEGQILTQVNFMGGIPMPTPYMYLQPQMPPNMYMQCPPVLTPQDQLAALSYQKAQIYAELNELNSKQKKVEEVIQSEGVNRNYACTEDLLNKYNENYEATRKQNNPTGQQYKGADEVAMSVQRLDDLLQRKKENKPIPFVDSYTPQRKGRAKPVSDTQSLTTTFSGHQPQHPPQENYYYGAYPQQMMMPMPMYYQQPQFAPERAFENEAHQNEGDSLEDLNPVEDEDRSDYNTQRSSSNDQKNHESRGVEFTHAALKKEAEAEGYLNKKKKILEQKLANDNKQTKKREETPVPPKKVVLNSGKLH